jgi:hypothetical protein
MIETFKIITGIYDKRVTKVTAYSKCGRTSALNNKLKVLLSRGKIDLLISPKIWFALLI